MWHWVSNIQCIHHKSKVIISAWTFILRYIEHKNMDIDSIGAYKHWDRSSIQVLVVQHFSRTAYNKGFLSARRYKQTAKFSTILNIKWCLPQLKNTKRLDCRKDQAYRHNPNTSNKAEHLTPFNTSSSRSLFYL